MIHAVLFSKAELAEIPMKPGDVAVLFIIPPGGRFLCRQVHPEHVEVVYDDGAHPSPSISIGSDTQGDA